MNNIRDLDYDLRPDHASNRNEHVALHRKISFSMVSRDPRQRRNRNTNIDDYLERLCPDVEVQSGLIE